MKADDDAQADGRHGILLAIDADALRHDYRTGNAAAMNVQPGDLQTAQAIAALAPRDVVSGLSWLIGFRDRAYRRKAVDALGLARGDSVLEIGCGAGRNFPLLQRAVGPQGTVIGLDASPAMVARARRRALTRRWTNVEIVLGDAVTCALPQNLAAVLSTYTLVAIPGYDQVIEAVFDALKPGGRCAVLDQKLPRGRASRLIPLVDRLSRPLPYPRILARRRVWEALQRHGGNLSFQEFYFGFVYLAVAEKAARPEHPGGPRPAASDERSARGSGEPSARE